MSREAHVRFWESAGVQLPRATHLNLSGTQTYLTMTAELLGEASLRFERYAALGQEDDHA